MSNAYYKELSGWLRQARADQHITAAAVALRTRMPLETIEKIEAGDLDFATPVFIQGYLKNYADAIGLDSAAVVREYKVIRTKIAYVTSDRGQVVARATAQHSGNPDDLSSEIIPFDPDSHAFAPHSELDQAVRKKISAEKWTNIIMMSSAACMVILSLYWVVSDDHSQDEETAANLAKYERKAETFKQAKIEPRKRLSFYFSEPILTDEEINRKLEVREREQQDSMRLAIYQKNQKWPSGQKVRAITVQEAALDYAQSMK